VIRLDLANVITISLAGVLGYGVLVAIVKVKSLVSGASASMTTSA
jgi:hypothetical protein